MKIELLGSTDKARNIFFEAYKLAVKLKISGYVKRHSDELAEIIVSGEPEAVTDYITQFQDLFKNAVRMNIKINDCKINYREFRLLTAIHQK